MAAFVRHVLADLPVIITEDASAVSFGGECGNLLCIPEGFDPRRPAFALLAHLDTPRSTLNVHPVVSSTTVTSDGTTALGVDNRAGIAVLLHALADHLRSRREGNFIIAFTVAEEAGPYGSAYIDLSPYNVRMTFVFDCSKRPGTFIQSAVGASLYDATFIGKSSHAGVAPEKGLNAIRLAAHALTRIPMGRLNASMTSNVGIISGGTATNVVPDRCRIQGEVRAFHAQDITRHLSEIQTAFRGVVDEHHGALEFESRVDFPPFVLEPTADIVRVTTNVLASVGLTPSGISYLGGSDANQLNARGYPAVNLGIGAQNPHGNDELILIEDLHTSEVMAQAFIQQSTALQ